jgi:hypothetical protein
MLVFMLPPAEEALCGCVSVHTLLSLALQRRNIISRYIDDQLPGEGYGEERLQTCVRFLLASRAISMSVVIVVRRLCRLPTDEVVSLNPHPPATAVLSAIYSSIEER